MRGLVRPKLFTYKVSEKTAPLFLGSMDAKGCNIRLEKKASLPILVLYNMTIRFFASTLFTQQDTLIRG